jgi:putative transposase
MANTYSQVNIQCVFAVKGRANVITPDIRDRVHAYLSATLKNQGAYPLAVGGWLDHVHVFFELPMTIAVSDLMRDLKAHSSKWINEEKLVKGRFNWQDGYGAFSYSHSQRDRVIKYIVGQEKHHRKQSFQAEYMEFLERFKVPHDKRYVFEFIEAPLLTAS